ncbi:hypothetical protein [Azospirillum picis]|uniref:J domain-containing protein n=1 Tax=Azospirillum picis TaxID=488438 RepID=A0ABU0MFF6_9PROT|nr:hypothetical protein [Azospirillum picis]MBP2298787.1 hypothetical protein [Azospirillum picis]MDQ0532164.1 hypothetical protein [Azospirillum picis]
MPVELASMPIPSIAMAARARHGKAVAHPDRSGADAVFTGERQIARHMIEHAAGQTASAAAAAPQ